MFSAAVFTCPNVSNAQALIPANQSLPEPTLVNEFLLNNQSNWTNPVLGNPPRPLQVIKCQSLTQPVYDFYQIEASRKACQIPPPIVNVLHPRHTPRVLSGLLAVATFLSVVLFGLILFWLAWAALLIGVCGSIGILAIVGCLVFCLLRCICCCCFPWEESSKDSQEAPEVEAPKPLQADKVIHSNRAVTSSVEVESLKSEIGWYESNGTAKQEHSYSWEPANEFNPFTLSYTSELQADTNSSTTADASQNNEVAASPSAAAVVTPELPNGRNDSGLHPDLQVPPVVCFKTKEGKKARKRDPVCQGLLIATYIVTLPVLTYVMVSAARMVPGGVKFFTTDTRVERLGPVPLPEPNQGTSSILDNLLLEGLLSWL